ncbi:transposase, partial [Deferribacter abyssi]|uniref:transposase n=1 Tax=Deferribacter abyssi TaxID=213806 RepID=UPI003C20F0C9
KKGDKSYYGYKAHVASDSVNGFILGVEVTGANVHESRYLEPLIKNLQEKGYIVTSVFGDKAYSSKRNREMLKSNDIEDFIMHKKVKGRDLTELQKDLNKFCKRVRYKIERSFGTLKSNYGLNRSRYLGIRKVLYEFLMKSICFNVVKAIRLCV